MVIAKPIAILSKAALVKSRKYYSIVAQNQPERQVILQKKMYKKHGNQYIEACSIWWPRYHTASYYIVVQWALHSAHRTCLSGDLGYKWLRWCALDRQSLHWQDEGNTILLHLICCQRLSCFLIGQKKANLQKNRENWDDILGLLCDLSPFLIWQKKKSSGIENFMILFAMFLFNETTRKETDMILQTYLYTGFLAPPLTYNPRFHCQGVPILTRNNQS